MLNVICFETTKSEVPAIFHYIIFFSLIFINSKGIKFQIYFKFIFCLLKFTECYHITC